MYVGMCSCIVYGLQSYTAYILVVVNPYQDFPLYSADVITQYINKPIGIMPPHVFAVADRAVRAVSEGFGSQSILVSGESGAGKTETTKHVMKYIAAVCRPDAKEYLQKEIIRVTSPREDDVGTVTLEDRILRANPILEAFGNAKTLRNNNSSRFVCCLMHVL